MDYDLEDPMTLLILQQMEREKIVKKCEGCGHYVRMKEEYAYCEHCMSRLERGVDLSGRRES